MEQHACVCQRVLCVDDSSCQLLNLFRTHRQAAFLSAQLCVRSRPIEGQPTCFSLYHEQPSWSVKDHLSPERRQRNTSSQADRRPLLTRRSACSPLRLLGEAIFDGLHNERSFAARPLRPSAQPARLGGKRLGDRSRGSQGLDRQELRLLSPYPGAFGSQTSLSCGSPAEVFVFLSSGRLCSAICASCGLQGCQFGDSLVLFKQGTSFYLALFVTAFETRNNQPKVISQRYPHYNSCESIKLTHGNGVAGAFGISAGKHRCTRQLQQQGQPPRSSSSHAMDTLLIRLEES
jgi:hypothetical protein